MTNESGSKDGERLAKMEVQVEQVNAVVIRMEAKLDAWATNFVTRTEAAEMFRARDKELQEVKDKQSNKATIFASWASVIVSILAVGVAIVAIIAA